jgi:type II secretory pathway pseudopilin PulG
MTEILAVIGIIVLLIAIALPALNSARRRAKVVATSATLEVITTALTAYHQDFLDYPTATTSDTAPTGVPGYAALGFNLVGMGGDATSPAPQVQNGKTYDIGDCVSVGAVNYLAIQRTVTGPPTAAWMALSGVSQKDQSQAYNYYFDGKLGPGMMVGSKAYGPYLQPERIRTRGAAFLDSWDRPIGYFPVHFKGANIRARSRATGGTAGPAESFGATYCAPSVNARWNLLDGWHLFIWEGESTTNTAIPYRRISVMLGDKNGDGIINPGETPLEDRPYILWSGGPDEKFGVKDPTSTATIDSQVQGCDDIMR